MAICMQPAGEIGKFHADPNCCRRKGALDANAARADD
jgi:hypothetical protein